MMVEIMIDIMKKVLLLLLIMIFNCCLRWYCFDDDYSDERNEYNNGCIEE